MGKQQRQRQREKAAAAAATTPTTTTAGVTTQASGGAEAGGATAAPTAGRILSPASAQLVDKELADLMNSLSVSNRFSTSLAAKPKPGTLGVKVQLLTNLFRIKVKDDIAYHYDLIFKLKKTAQKKKAAGVAGDQTPGFTDVVKVRRVLTVLFQRLKEQDADLKRIKAVFDGKQNMFTLKSQLPLDVKEQEFEAEVDGEKRGVWCKYSFTGHSLALNEDKDISRDAMQALEIALGHEAGLAMIQRGSRFFERGVTPLEVGGLNLELRLGFVKSLKVAESGLFINLDRAAALFEKGGPMSGVMCNILNFGGRQNQAPNPGLLRIDGHMKDSLERELCNMRYEFVNPGLGYRRRYKVERDSFTTQNVQQLKFDWIEGGVMKQQQISVFDYFRQKYRYTLKFPNLPCFKVGANKQNMIPVELCTLIHEQYYDKKMHEKIQAKVTQETIQPPNKRFQQIKGSMTQLAAHVQKTIDCQISLEPTQVAGRIISPPAVAFMGQPKVTISQSGDKYMNPCDFKWGKFNSSIELKKWAVVQVQDHASEQRVMKDVDRRIIDFARKLASVGKQNGWIINQTFGQFCHNFQDYARLRHFMSFLKEKECQLVLFIMPSDLIYADIKKVGNELGLTTQCVKLNVDDNFMMNERGKINKISSNTFVNNMLMKMNAKFGGENARLADVSMPAFLKQKVMILGMDVFHPGPGSALKHSLAGFVASYTRCFTKYFQQAKAQKHPDSEDFRRKEEIGGDILFNVMLFFFNKWKGVNKCYPDYVLVFRDGVSEGQFEKVRLIELDQIYRAMDRLGFKAKVTFITVQKRHHFRMFVKDERNGDIDNPSPGTVVDTGIVHPERFECYLNSHYALKGTAKPSHYCVVHNACGLSADDMQQIAYYLCYLCARCYKPISIPIPVKYAHLVSEAASKSLSSAVRNQLRGTPDEWIAVHENFEDKLNYA